MDVESSSYAPNLSVILRSTVVNLTDGLATAFAVGSSVGTFKITLYAKAKMPTTTNLIVG